MKRSISHISLILAATGCMSTGSDLSERPIPSAKESMTAPYSPGTWRLVPAPELGRSVLWVSHIVIRHAQSKRQRVASSAPWPFPTPNPARTRTEAMVLAQEIAGRAKERPNEFGVLARRYSDDPSTADRNGSLGTLRASEMLAWPVLLDAIEILRVGQVSEPIDTVAGVVILLRNPTPIQQMVSGAHIVVNHQDVPWLRTLGAQVPRRTYEQAWRRALEIHQELTAHPERFGDLAAQQSDHPDKSRGGDIGSWSTLEPTYMPRVLEEIRLLEPGEISQPFETAFGIEIVQRTEHRPRPAYAMQALRFRYDPSADGAVEAAWAKAESAVSELRGTPPQAFDQMLREGCCKDVVAKVEGRDDDALISLLRNLPIGAIADRPVAVDAQVLLVKRLALWDAPPPRLVTLGLARSSD